MKKQKKLQRERANEPPLVESWFERARERIAGLERPNLDSVESTCEDIEHELRRLEQEDGE